jgi:hypothetical protein
LRESLHRGGVIARQSVGEPLGLSASWGRKESPGHSWYFPTAIDSHRQPISVDHSLQSFWRASASRCWQDLKLKAFDITGLKAGLLGGLPWALWYHWGKDLWNGTPTVSKYTISFRYTWMNKLGQAWAYGALHVSLDAPFISGWWWSWSAIGICGAGLLGGKHLGKYPPRGDRWYSIFDMLDSTFKPRRRRRQRYSLVCSPPVLRTHLLVAQEQIQELLRWLVDGICSFQLCLLIRHSKQHVSTMTNYDKLMIHIWKSNKHHL